VSEARRQLAEAVLSSGGRIGEALGEATASRITRCAEQYRKAGVTDGDLLAFSGLAPETLLTAVVACWNTGAAAWVTPCEPETFAAHGASFTVTPGFAEEITTVRKVPPGDLLPDPPATPTAARGARIHRRPTRRRH